MVQRNTFKKIIISILVLCVIVFISIYILYVVLLRGIPSDRTINEFKENIEYFNIAASYLEKESRIYEITFKKEKLKIYDMSGVDNNSSIEISDERAYNAIAFILHNLKYDSIDVYEGDVRFRKQMLLTSDDGIWYIQNNEDLESIGSTFYELIEDNWYYYLFPHI